MNRNAQQSWHFGIVLGFGFGAAAVLGWEQLSAGLALGAAVLIVLIAGLYHPGG